MLDGCVKRITKRTGKTKEPINRERKDKRKIRIKKKERMIEKRRTIRGTASRDEAYESVRRSSGWPTGGPLYES